MSEKKEHKEKNKTIDYDKEKLTLSEKYHLTVNQFQKINWAKWPDVKKQTLVVTGISVGMIGFFALIDYAVLLVKDIL